MIATKYRVDEETQRNSLFAYQNLSAEEKEVLAKDYNYYQVDFKNVGGLVMPIIIELKYVDGSSEVRYIPAEIWRYNSNKVSKVFVTEKEIKEFILDPYLETADVERENNYFPRRRKPTRFEMFSPR